MEDSWYKQLCKDFLSMGSKFIDDKALTELKHNYAFIIDSKRKLEKVKDLESLLKVLEKRDELNAYEIEPLKLISQRYIKNICLQERIKIYEELIKNKSYPDINMYFHSTGKYQNKGGPLDYQKKLQQDNCKIRKRLNSSFFMLKIYDVINIIITNLPCISIYYITNSYTFTILVVFIKLCLSSKEHERSDEARGQQESICNSSTSMASQIINPTINLQSGGTRTYDSNYQKYQHLLKEEVVLQLSNRLGRSWRDVGRLLKLRECDITSICMKNSNVQVQSYEALKLGLANYDFDAWKIRLLESLGDARRKDLQEFARDLICK
ncbi:uncharacterized protein Fadd isoform X1 [Prorops nasuta]|uniref:uncharacterized protein Fadd isoform X1 n=1 Tax=Prorops nasuta TaxID=863751 RepID=UPI0034CD5C12